MRKLTEIIVHCSATEAGKDFKAKDIDRWHKAKGWTGIGYNYVVDLDGTVEQGRDLDKAGAHTSGHNVDTVGICYIGGLKGGKAADTRTEAQRTAIERLIKSLKVCFPTIRKVSGHRDYAAKACPCFDAGKEYQHIVQ